jgi:hypothetical protein
MLLNTFVIHNRCSWRSCWSCCGKVTGVLYGWGENRMSYPRVRLLCRGPVYHGFKVQPDDGPLKRPKHVVAASYILRYISHCDNTPQTNCCVLTARILKCTPSSCFNKHNGDDTPKDCRLSLPVNCDNRQLSQKIRSLYRARH